MIVYEVNIEVEDDIYSDYCIWLIEHIKEMMSFTGFLEALLMEEAESENHKISVQYKIESKEALELYLKNHALKMRGSVPTIFQNKFVITRRVLGVSQQFYSNDKKF